MPKFKLLPSEIILDDDFSVYPGYTYIGDMRIIQSPIEGTVRALKAQFDPPLKEVRRCDIFGHEGMTTTDRFEEPDR